MKGKIKEYQLEEKNASKSIKDTNKGLIYEKAGSKHKPNKKASESTITPFTYRHILDILSLTEWAMHLELESIIHLSTYYPGSGDHFDLMSHLSDPLSDPPNWVFVDWGGIEDKKGKQQLPCGNESSFGSFKPKGWSRVGKIEIITDQFFQSFGRNFESTETTTYEGGKLTIKTIKMKVLHAQFQKVRTAETRHAIFCLGFDGIDLYRKLYTNGLQCGLYIQKQGVGTKDGQHKQYYGERALTWEQALDKALRSAPPNLLYNWSGYGDLPDTLDDIFPHHKRQGRYIELEDGRKERFEVCRPTLQ